MSYTPLQWALLIVGTVIVIKIILTCWFGIMLMIAGAVIYGIAYILEQ